MALLDFPSGPSLNDTTTQNGNTWKWNGTSWVAFNNLSLSSQVTGILAVQYGGTGFGGTYTVGDILYASSSNTFAKLAAGTAGSVLASGGPTNAPYWKVDDAGTGSVSAGTIGGFAYYNNSTTSITSGAGFSYIGGGSNNNVVLKNGYFSLIGSTIDSGTWNGSAIGVPYGGTGLTTISTGQIIYGSGSNTYSALSHPGAGYALTTVGSTVAWIINSNLSVGYATTSVSSGTANTATTAGTANTATTAGTANTATTAGTANTATTAGTANTATTAGSAYTSNYSLNLVGGGAGQVPYQSSINGTSFLSHPGAGYALTTVGSTVAWIINSNLSVGYATTSVSSGTANTATTAGTANTATTAGTANTATTAGTANTATTAGTANTATTAGTANTATTAGTANTATTAGSAYTSNYALNLVGGGAGQLHYQSSINGTSFLSHPGAGYALTTLGSNTLAYAALTDLAVTYLSAGTAMHVSANKGAVTVNNIGVQSISGASNQISASGSTGAVTLSLPSTVVVSDIQLQGGSSTLTNVGGQPTSMVNKQYVDNLASGLDVHGSVRVVLTAGLGGSYYQPNGGIGSSAIGAYITSIGNSDLTSVTFDGKTLAVNQRVLVAGGLTGTGKTSILGSGLVTPSNSYVVNGIYLIGSVGSGSSQWYMYRATDTDDNTELTAGTFTFVEEGTSYADTGWVCTNDTTNLGPIQFGGTAVTFSQFTGAAAINFGQGLTKVGNTVATNVNLSSTGVATGIGYTQFNIGGAGLTGVADTGYFPTFSVRTSGNTVAGTALLQLNSTGFSLTGSTNTPATLTITGDISIPNPGGTGKLPYSSDSNTLSFLTNPGAGYALTTVGSSGVAWTTIANLSVGYATTSVSSGTANTATTAGTANTATTAGTANTATTAGSAYTSNYSLNLVGGGAGQVPYQSSINGTSFLSHPGAGYALTTVGSTVAWIINSNLSVGYATTSVSSGTANTATTAGTANTATTAGTANTATTAGTANTATTAGTANTATTAGSAYTSNYSLNLVGGGAGQIPYQSSINGTSFLTHPGAGYALTTVGSTVAWIVNSNLSVGYATTSVSSGTANTATTAGTANTATTAGTANTATSAGTANTATSAGTANTATTAGIANKVGITTSVADASYPIAFAFDHQPSTALGSSTLLTYNPSTGKITNGIWAGTAITTGRGGTGLTTVDPNQVLIGAATGNTWAGLASTLLPVAVISDTPPAKPGGAIGNTQPGQLWWDSQYGVLKIYYTDPGTATTINSQWVDATPVLGSSGGGSSTKRSYVMTFGAGFTPSSGADTVQLLVPYAPDNTSKYYYIKRLDYRNETAGTGASFYIDRHTAGGASFSSANRIHTAGSATGASFYIGSGIFITSYTLSSTGASFVSSSGVAASVISGDYLRLNFTNVSTIATLSVSIVIEEQ